MKNNNTVINGVIYKNGECLVVQGSTSDEFLEEIKIQAEFKHENNRISLSDEICIMSLVTEYCNRLDMGCEDEKRIFLEGFAEFLEKYLEVCTSNGRE
jgi:hypothetical protein